MKNSTHKILSALKQGTLLVLFAATCTAPASAQNLLKGLAGKAVQKAAGKVAEKVEKKVEQKLEGTKAGKVLSVAKTVANASNSSEAESEGSYTSADYPENLAYIVDSGDYWHFEVDEESVPAPEFKNCADLLTNFPVLPAATDLFNEEVMKQFYVKTVAFNKGFEAYVMNRTAHYTEVMMRTRNVMNPTVDSSTREYMNLLAMAMAKLPEAEREKLASMEDGDAEAMLNYLKTNHPDIYKLIMEKGKNIKPARTMIDEDRVAEFDALAAELEPLTTSMQDNLLSLTNALTSGSLSDAADMFTSKVGQVRQQLADEWAKSPECAKVKAMQAELDARTDEWDKKNKTMDKFREYPPFWDEERTKQNQVIDAYNKTVAERFRAAVQEAIDEQAAKFKVVADCDSRLAALGIKNDDEAFLYANVLALISGAMAPFQVAYFPLPSEVLNVPFVQHALLSNEMPK